MALEDLPSTLYDSFSRIGKALSNAHRLRILNIVCQGEYTVDDLAQKLGQSRANTSIHLKVLHQARMVKRRKEGRRVYYQIASDQALRLWLSLRDTALAELPEVRDLMRRYTDDPNKLSIIEGDELIEKVASGEVILVDLRPAKEYRSGHIPGARSLPITELQDRIDELDDAQQVVAYCRGPYCLGEIRGVARLREAGIDAYQAKESVLEWRARGLILEVGGQR